MAYSKNYKEEGCRSLYSNRIIFYFNKNSLLLKSLHYFIK